MLWIQETIVLLTRSNNQSRNYKSWVFITSFINQIVFYEETITNKQPDLLNIYKIGQKHSWKLVVSELVAGFNEKSIAGITSWKTLKKSRMRLLNGFGPILLHVDNCKIKPQQVWSDHKSEELIITLRWQETINECGK